MTTEEQKCTKCGISKPIHFFHREGNTYRRQCADCRNIKRREQAEQRWDNQTRTCFHCEKTKILREFIDLTTGRERTGGRTKPQLPTCNQCVESDVEHLRCRRCKELKPRSDFSKDNNTDIGLTRHCKKCARLFHLEYKNKNPERYRTLSRKNQERQFYKNLSRAWSKRLYEGAKRRSRQRNITLSISKEDIKRKIEETNNHCAVTNIPFKAHYGNTGGHNKYNAFAPALDRKNPTQGYTPRNSRVVVNIYNMARGKAKDEHLLHLSRKILIPDTGVPKKIEIKGSDITLDQYIGKKIATAKVRSSGWRDFFNLDKEWFHEQIKDGRCPVTGIPYEIILGTSGVDEQNDWSPSIDKINPQGGYLKDNCRVVVTLYNRAKNIWTDKELRTLATALSSKDGFA